MVPLMCVAIVACSMDKVHATRVRLTHIENGEIFGSNLIIADNEKWRACALHFFCVLVRNNVGANLCVRPIGMAQM